MLTELCQELRNWFDQEQYFGTFEITNGSITAPFLVDGQYYRIIGSIFNDGVHKYSKNTRDITLQDETFTGSVWSMAIPQAVINLADEIVAWRKKYEDPNSAAMSPFTSENYFGDYSYSKNAPGNSAGAGSSAVSWVSVFKARLNPWRKIL